MLKVSLITITFNSEKYLEDTIRSVCNQSYSNIEYIVIDGASTDSTIDIIKDYNYCIDYWVSERDRGIYHAMNKGILAASGDIIGIINSDDWLETDAVENVVHASSKLPSTEFLIHGKIATYTAEKEFIEIRSSRDTSFGYLFSTPFKHPATFVSKSLYQKVGLYNEDCGLAADYDFMLRVIYKDYPTKFVDKVLANMRLVGISTSGEEKASDEELYQILLKNTGSRVMAVIGILGRTLNNILSTLFK